MSLALHGRSRPAVQTALSAPTPPAPRPRPSAPAAAAPLRVFIYAGLKTHAVGQHDYPQFLADWSKILTERGAYVTGGLQFPVGARPRERRRHGHLQG